MCVRVSRGEEIAPPLRADAYAAFAARYREFVSRVCPSVTSADAYGTVTSADVYVTSADACVTSEDVSGIVSIVTSSVLGGLCVRLVVRVVLVGCRRMCRRPVVIWNGVGGHGVRGNAGPNGIAKQGKRLS